jgi:hypothetical protein
MADKPDTRSALRVTYEHAPEGTRATAPGSDLSLGGVFIETVTTLPVGALLSLEIESGSTKVALDARILSRRAAEGPGRPAGLAVSFIDLPNDAAASLHFILSTRMPRKGTMLGLGEAEDDIPTYQSERKLPAAPDSKVEAAPLARPPTPVMEANASAAAPPPQVARPATPPISHPPAAAAPHASPTRAPAPAAAVPHASPSWAPAPAPAAHASASRAPSSTAAAPVSPRHESPRIVIGLVIALLVVLAAAAWLTLHTLSL